MPVVLQKVQNIPQIVEVSQIQFVDDIVEVLQIQIVDEIVDVPVEQLRCPWCRRSRKL